MPDFLSVKMQVFILFYPKIMIKYIKSIGPIQGGNNEKITYVDGLLFYGDAGICGV